MVRGKLDDPDWLSRQYHTLDKSLYDIADELGYAHTTVWKRFQEYGINCSRDVDDRLDDPGWLERKYINERWTIRQIAEECDCGYNTARRRLKKFDISTRDRGEANQNRDPEGIERAQESLDGELLGDGSLLLGERSVNAWFSYGVKHEAHRDWVIRVLESTGIEGTPGRDVRDDGAVSYRYQTRAYPYLTEQHERWYPGGGEKRVPGDLELTPRAILHWYVGDGGVSQRDGNGYLHTLNFPQEDVELLASKLEDLGVECNVRAHDGEYPQIFLPKSGLGDLFGLVSVCPPALEGCYGHKWPRDGAGD